MHQFVIHKDVPVINEDKRGIKFLGDVPICRYNEETKKFEEVVNPRGNAYAARYRLKYRIKRV